MGSKQDVREAIRRLLERLREQTEELGDRFDENELREAIVDLLRRDLDDRAALAFLLLFLDFEREDQS